MEHPRTLFEERLEFKPRIPKTLRDIAALNPSVAKAAPTDNGWLKDLFPNTWQQGSISFDNDGGASHSPLRVGVVLSGGQAPGGHNVISGLYDALKTLHTESCLLGFKNGPSGILDNDTVEINESLLKCYRNTGGFDIIGSGRTKIESIEQMEAAEKTVRDLKLDGLVIIGGDDSNTNAALLAEFFLEKGCQTKVTGVPKTVDGDLKNEHIEISFGFDSATKVYSELIGNILRDARSAKKYYHFVKLMGRSASHIALECALQTHPHLALISEEIAAKNMTFQQIVNDIADMVAGRAADGKNYGVVLIPEGVIEFIPEFKVLISELNNLLAREDMAREIEGIASRDEKTRFVSRQLSWEAKRCFDAIPENIQNEMLLERDPHGNVQVSKIETERLFTQAVRRELRRRASEGNYQGKFSTQPHFFGYSGRSAFPSNFDSQYCYSLGFVAAVLIDAGMTGYMGCVCNLAKDVGEWKIKGIPLTTMMTMEERHGKSKPVIKKALVELDGAPFKYFEEMRETWKYSDDYACPGPMQFYGPKELSEATTLTLQHEHQELVAT